MKKVHKVQHNRSKLRRTFSDSDLTCLLENESESAYSKFGGFSSTHEGFAVIYEELQELFDLIRARRGDTYSALIECIQIMATARQYIFSCISGGVLDEVAEIIDGKGKKNASV